MEDGKKWSPQRVAARRDQSLDRTIFAEGGLIQKRRLERTRQQGIQVRCGGLQKGGSVEGGEVRLRQTVSLSNII